MNCTSIRDAHRCDETHHEHFEGEPVHVAYRRERPARVWDRPLDTTLVGVMSNTTIHGEIGECLLTRIDRPEHGDFVIRIDRADPRILITAEFLDQAIFAPTKMLWMDFSNEQICYDDHAHDNATCYRLRSVMHIKGVNREVLYRITPHEGRSDVYNGRWPD